MVPSVLEVVVDGMADVVDDEMVGEDEEEGADDDDEEEEAVAMAEVRCSIDKK